MPDEYFCHFYFVIETAYASPGFYGLYPINNWSNSSARAATQLEITITPFSWSNKLNACLRKKSHIHPLSLVSPNHQWYQKNAFLKAVKSWQRFKCNKTSVWIFKGKNEWGLSKKCCNVNLFNGLAYHNVDQNVFETKIFEKDINYVVVVYEMCMIESIPSLALLFRTFWWEITGRCQIPFAQAWKHQINGVQMFFKLC